MAAPADPVVVRPAVRDDIPAIVAVSLSSVGDEDVIGFGAPRSEQTFADATRLSAAWRDPNLVRGEEVFVAELGGRVVGCVTLEERVDSLELVNIDVAREFQGRTIGTQIVRFVERRARREGKPAVTLGTSRNASGIPWKSLPWWQHLGYQITHEEENAWTKSIGPGVREIRMVKEVGSGGAVLLREVAEGDLPTLFEYQRDPLAHRMAAFTSRDPDDRQAFMDHWHRILRDESVVMRTVMVDGDVVGTVGRFLDREFGRPEVTFWIGRTYWGQGLATRALQAFLKEHPERPLYARAALDNGASVRVLEKCGFTIVAHARGFANARGKEIDEAVLELPPPPG